MTAGGPQVCVWDLLGGGRLLHKLTHHQKTVTCLCMSPTAGPAAAVAAPRLLTGSLDGHVKVRGHTTSHDSHSCSLCIFQFHCSFCSIADYSDVVSGVSQLILISAPSIWDFDCVCASWCFRATCTQSIDMTASMHEAVCSACTWPLSSTSEDVATRDHSYIATRPCGVQVHELDAMAVVHASRYPHPVLSLALSPDCGMLAVGMANGLLSLRKHARPKPLEDAPGIVPTARSLRQCFAGGLLSVTPMTCHSPEFLPLEQ